MLAGDWAPQDAHAIDFTALPRIPSTHVVVSDARPHKGVNQHNYLLHHGGRFWVMWSDGPGIEDRVGQRVKFSRSDDGLEWDTPRYLTPPPPGSGVGSPYYNTRSDKGFRYISRGFWVREGQLLALASLDEADGFFGAGLALHAFRYREETDDWEDAGVVYENTINNFPPKRIPTGQWMMSRRTYDRHVYFLVGGEQTLDVWESYPAVYYGDTRLKAEEPYWWVLPGGHLMALYRDNNKSGYLFRSFSVDHGRSWSAPTKTNFPDAASKFNGLQLRDGRFVLVSNANPKQRDPLVLSVGDNGMVFNRMGYLVGGRRVDYPHVIEEGDYLLVAFSGGKSTVEVLKIKTADLDILDETQGKTE